MALKLKSLLNKSIADSSDPTGTKSRLEAKIPINYQGRTYKEGKKIKAIDGLKAILALIRYRFFDK